MVREPPRKCSFCGQHGHNSRTCNNNSKASATTFNNNNKPHSVKLFGVNINDETASPSEDPIKKSKSMGNLIVAADGNEDADAAANSTDTESGDGGGGYLSDGLIHNKRRKAAHERKKGTPWSEEEHRVFLMGLNDLGKGDWRGISMKYVHTRTPTQVASHAQKYFLRQSSNDRKKRRSSLFDMPYTPEYDSASSSSRVKPVPETPQLASRPHFLPGNSSAELMQRFPHLCLDKYPVPIRPAPANYHPVPYPYTMGIPANVQACWPMSVFNFGTQSYLYNNNNNHNNTNGIGAVMVHHHHPSGIPSATTPTSDPVAAGKLDGLELEIGLPQPSPATSAPSSPASGAIKVT